MEWEGFVTIGKRDRERRGDLWIAAEAVRKAPGHPFYAALNELLRVAGFDDFVENLCRPFYSTTGKPGLPPGIYFRALFVGYFEGIGSERGIDWRCADSLSLGRFLGVPITENTPDHSTLSKTRKRLPLEVHQQAFDFVLALLADQGLLSGEGVAIDASLLHANASMDSLVRRDTGESYAAFLTRIARESGIETPTKADLKKIDRERKKKGTKKTKNDDWSNPHDPDAKVMKTRNNGTKMTYKAENAVDTDSGAIICATIHAGDTGDSRSGMNTLEAANEALSRLSDARPNAPLPGDCVVTDSGYHSDDVLTELEDAGFNSVIAERDRRRRNWQNSRCKRPQDARAALYRNRRRLQTQRGKRLHKRRAEFSERAFAHLLDSGGFRRVHVRGENNVAKRYAIHAAGFNLGLLMRHFFGVGKPRCLQANAALATAISWLLSICITIFNSIIHPNTIKSTNATKPHHQNKNPQPSHNPTSLNPRWSTAS